MCLSFLPAHPPILPCPPPCRTLCPARYEPFPVESSLPGQLADHFNAEVVAGAWRSLGPPRTTPPAARCAVQPLWAATTPPLLLRSRPVLAAGTIKSTQDAVDYLTWTFFIRHAALRCAALRCGALCRCHRPRLRTRQPAAPHALAAARLPPTSRPPTSAAALPAPPGPAGGCFRTPRTMTWRAQNRRRSQHTCPPWWQTCWRSCRTQGVSRCVPVGQQARMERRGQSATPAPRYPSTPTRSRPVPPLPAAAAAAPTGGRRDGGSGGAAHGSHLLLLLHAPPDHGHICAAAGPRHGRAGASGAGSGATWASPLRSDPAGSAPLSDAAPRWERPPRPPRALPTACSACCTA